MDLFSNNIMWFLGSEDLKALKRTLAKKLTYVIIKIKHNILKPGNKETRTMLIDAFLESVLLI